MKIPNFCIYSFDAGRKISCRIQDGFKGDATLSWNNDKGYRSSIDVPADVLIEITQLFSAHAIKVLGPPYDHKTFEDAMDTIRQVVTGIVTTQHKAAMHEESFPGQPNPYLDGRLK